MENNEDYKLTFKDFIPYIGLKKYMERVDCNENSEPRATKLLFYNGFVTIAIPFLLILPLAKGIESLIK